MLNFLKEVLGENYTEQIEKELSAHIGKNFVSRKDFNEINLLNKELVEKLETLETNSAQNSDLETKIREMEGLHKDEIRKMKLDYAIEMALKRSGAKNEKAVWALIDSEQIQIDEIGNIVGIEEQIENLKKSDSFLFDLNGFKGLTPAENVSEVRKAPTAMSYTELCEYFSTRKNA